MARQQFEYRLGERVKLLASGECGCIIAMACYHDGGNRFLVRYKAADGRLVEQWWSSDALSSIETL